MIDDVALDRRAMLERMALLLGVAALPVEAMARPTAHAKPFLSAPVHALLTAVIDTILPATDTPGAVAAEVPARLDAMIGHWASAQTRGQILEALDRIDVAAKAQKGKPFVRLTPAERAEFLEPHDAVALKNVPPPADAPKASIFAMGVNVADPGYYRIKDLTINLYYFSPVGSESELLYEHVPGQWQPSIKASPETRPFLGPGPY